jgi:D-hydroxyproline dehydrogenase subunit beta
MTPKADVVVIGAGIIGAACAYYLSSAGVDVHLVEGRFPASGTSRACDSLILAFDKSAGAELELSQASAALWTGLAHTLDMDFEYERHGSLWLFESVENMNAALGKARSFQAAGVQLQILDARDVHSLEPGLAPDVAGGYFFPDDAQVDARRATLALLSAARQRGLTLHANAPVTAVERASNGRIVRLVTRAGEIMTDTVVCAAGVWSNEVSRLVGLELPIRPRKGHILVTAKIPRLVRHPLLEAGYTSTVQSASQDLQVALVAEMTAGGTLLLGSSREFAGLDRAVSLQVMQAIAARAVRFLPALAQVGVIRSYAGLRPWSPDHLPLVGPVGAAPGFYLATGHEGAGIGLAPITGRLVADCITGASLPAFAAQVRPDRFELGPAGPG